MVAYFMAIPQLMIIRLYNIRHRESGRKTKIIRLESELVRDCVRNTRKFHEIQIVCISLNTKAKNTKKKRRRNKALL